MHPTDDMILNLIVQACGTPHALDDGVDLIDSGLMDSLARITLFEGLEDLGVDLSPTQVPPDTLRSARAILDRVHTVL